MISLTSLVHDLRAKRITPVEHVEDVLERLAGDRCNAVIELDADRALRRAAELTAAPEPVGPLHGVAVGIKDLIDVAGLPTRCGSAILRDAPPAGVDAPVVARLRAAGAVIVGKLHTHEFAYGPIGDTAATGPAHNPHDLTRITGGSSSGSAAAVAAGHLALAIGTDTGASVRTPAALCGVVGFKPRRGVLPGEGVFPLAESFDTVGLLAADAASVSYAWDAVRGRAPGGWRPAGTGLHGLRVGLPDDPYWTAADPVLADAAGAAARDLERAGAEIVAVSTPDVAELAATYPVIAGAEAYATHREWFTTRRDEYQQATGQRLAEQADAPAHRYVDAQRTRRRLGDRMIAHVGATADLLLTPTTRLRATPIGVSEVDGLGVRPAMLGLTSPFNVTDRPAVSVPVPVPGLPAGVQLAGITVGEDAVLAAAAAVGTS
ncbi:amidase [Pseudonocardia endophytica]|uniref:Aspartyl-tRNA(Asn)/glutamyl-tRNA(Gln) amidotransferase subunit A n=1 Tax=Pseudonocardia endophytica TaxID=401976 RepID=A0A4R1HWS7_PSEEN|nr:amidase [Pseudonocardia endophytica]TCK27187.1 aspartyl-tRNA(Asn)/glutamyl-tRNA(Gln) amidotransferase subunit A [Pseudonocardia endophytica]